MQDVQPSREVLAMTLMGLPEGIQAGAIMVDPGIAFRAYSAKGEGRSPQKHYQSTPFKQMATLPVKSIAAEDCFLFLWIPLRSVFLAAADAGMGIPFQWDSLRLGEAE